MHNIKYPSCYDFECCRAFALIPNHVGGCALHARFSRAHTPRSSWVASCLSVRNSVATGPTLGLLRQALESGIDCDRDSNRGAWTEIVLEKTHEGSERKELSQGMTCTKWLSETTEATSAWKRRRSQRSHRVARQGPTAYGIGWDQHEVDPDTKAIVVVTMKKYDRRLDRLRIQWKKNGPDDSFYLIRFLVHFLLMFSFIL